MADEKPELFQDDWFEGNNDASYEQYLKIMNNPDVPQQLKNELEYAAEEDVYSSYKSVMQRVEESIKKAESLANTQQQLKSSPAPGENSSINTHELLMLAEPGFGSYCKWIDQVWNHLPTGTPKDYRKVILEVFFQNDGIDFDGFVQEANQLKHAHQQLESSVSSVRTNLNTLFDSWTGAGAQGAYTKWQSGIFPKASQLSADLEDSSVTIMETIKEIHETLKNQVDEMIQKRITTVEGAELEVAAMVATIANKGGEATDEECAFVAPFLNVYYGFSANQDNDDYVRTVSDTTVDDYIEYNDQDEIVPFCKDWCERFKKHSMENCQILMRWFRSMSNK